MEKGVGKEQWPTATAAAATLVSQTRTHPRSLAAAMMAKPENTNEKQKVRGEYDRSVQWCAYVCTHLHRVTTRQRAGERLQKQKIRTRHSCGKQRQGTWWRWRTMKRQTTSFPHGDGTATQRCFSLQEKGRDDERTSGFGSIVSPSTWIKRMHFVTPLTVFRVTYTATTVPLQCPSSSPSLAVNAREWHRHAHMHSPAQSTTPVPQ